MSPLAKELPLLLSREGGRLLEEEDRAESFLLLSEWEGFSVGDCTKADSEAMPEGGRGRLAAVALWGPLDVRVREAAR